MPQLHSLVHIFLQVSVLCLVSPTCVLDCHSIAHSFTQPPLFALALLHSFTLTVEMRLSILSLLSALSFVCLLSTPSLEFPSLTSCDSSESSLSVAQQPLQVTPLAVAISGLRIRSVHAADHYDDTDEEPDVFGAWAASSHAIVQQKQKADDDAAAAAAVAAAAHIESPAQRIQRQLQENAALHDKLSQQFTNRAHFATMMPQQQYTQRRLLLRLFQQLDLKRKALLQEQQRLRIHSHQPSQHQQHQQQHHQHHEALQLGSHLSRRRSATTHRQL